MSEKEMINSLEKEFGKDYTASLIKENGKVEMYKLYKEIGKKEFIERIKVAQTMKVRSTKKENPKKSKRRSIQVIKKCTTKTIRK